MVFCSCHALAQEQNTVQELRTRLKEGEVDAANSQKEAQERVSQLQKELIRYQEQSVSREFEMKGQLCRLTSDLESARKENADSTAHVYLLKAQLASQQELLSQAQAQLVERRQELQASTDALGAEKALSAKNQATIKELSQELQSFRAERGDKDALLKSQLIKDTRQTRAFQEIKRLIDWATTPPSSARSSGGIRGVDATTPCSGAVAGMPSHTGGDLGSPVLSSAVELQHLGRIDELADAAAPPHLPVSSTSQVSHRQSKPLAAAALYRLRSSLTALAAVE
ncbi:kinesin motor domain-containing protein, partial [Haematococcus lacustris]